MENRTLNTARMYALASATVLMLLSACSSTFNQAPVIDRLPSRNLEGGMTASTDGFYTVKAGDTLYAIALEFGHDWRELARANNLTDPNKIFVGQKLKVEGFGGNTPAAAAPAVGTGGSDAVVEVNPVAPAGSVKPVEPPKPIADTPVEPPKPFAATAGFVWPHPGEVIQPYKAGVNKGIDLAAKVGDPVVAAQAGKVVYSGNALRGYGNLIILKHDNNLLTAYAHNKTLLVKEGEPVTKGQKIAEAGQSDSDRPKLHFEVRKQGKPVDPMEYLPAKR